jgi:O-antigen/teichoic acid export membrane protein
MYLKNYFKIYYWKILSIFSGFLSLVLVVPNISDNSVLYGIYMFVMSISLYLSYADIGFLSAGQKYSAEYFAINDIKNEKGVMGFVFMLMLITFLPFIVLMLVFSLDPYIAFKELEASGAEVASKLFLIMGLLFPLQILLQRVMNMILAIRLLDYISTRFEIVTNIIKILSIFYFFGNEKYMLIEYFLFCTLITIFCYMLVGVTIKYKINYNFLELFKSFSLNKKYFYKTKDLALSSFIATLSFIIFYEIDLILIGKFVGARELAIYAIAFTFLNFLRSLWVIIYTPVTSRINHFVGLKQLNKLYDTIEILVKFTMPLYFFGVFILFINAEKLLLLWVGEYYLSANILLQFLLISVFFNYLIQPATQYFYACTKYKYIFINALALPFVFFSSIYFLYDSYGVLSFAIGKLLAIMCSFLICAFALSKVTSSVKISLQSVIPLVLFSFLIYFCNIFFAELLFSSTSKDILKLIFFMMYLSIIFVISYLIMILIYKQNRIFLSEQYKRLIE